VGAPVSGWSSHSYDPDVMTSAGSAAPEQSSLAEPGPEALPGAPEAPAARPLTAPRGGPPQLVDTAASLAAVEQRLQAATGPVAVDAERASGHRYGGRAYLVQLHRAGVGTLLVDPVPFADLTSLSEALADAEWVIHAASQDLPCLREAGMAPRRLFDTELAGRLLGYERVGLATMVERLLGWSLAKEHSAQDWSARPLPGSWLTYAALDVELLLELRDVLAAELDATGKLEWAEQEFGWLVTAPPAPPRVDPWRRVSGIHRVRGRGGLAEVRALWEARDSLARRRDVAPHRVLPDPAIIAAVAAHPVTRTQLLALPVFGGPRMRRAIDTWWEALTAARALSDDELPQSSPHGDGPPAVAARWAERDPVAATRLTAVRGVLTTVAAEHGLPVENLLEPALSRRLAWAPPAGAGSVDVVAGWLAEGDAREWQVGLTAPGLAAALAGG